MEKVPPEVRRGEKRALVIDGLEVLSESPVRGEWAAYPLGHGRILLRAEVEGEASPEMSGVGYGRLTVSALVDVLRGFHTRAWTGMLTLDCGFGLKKLYFSQGDLVFAASNVIDDRLGEVIYRDGLISLDELTNSTSKVTRDQKFGQVLLASGVFDPHDLWKALTLQVRQIFSSVFMVDALYVESFPGVRPFTEVVFQGGTGALIDECDAFGHMFRSFTSRLHLDSQIHPAVFDEAASYFPRGTYLADFMALVRETGTVERLLEISKVQEPYTLATLLLLLNRGLCRVAPIEPPQIPQGPTALLPLKSYLKAYELLLKDVREAFALENKDFPLRDLDRLALSLNADGMPIFFLNAEAGIADESLAHIYSQCLAVRSKVERFISFVDSLTRFMLQVSADTLSSEASRRIRNTYRNLGPL